MGACAAAPRDIECCLVLEWATLAGVAVTAVATAVLAVVTWWAVRGADRTARAAEQTLALQTRAFLVPARRGDPPQHIVFHGGHPLEPDVAGGMAVLQDTGESIYMGIALRNVGLGLALLYRWHLSRGLLTPETLPGDFSTFTGLARALHVPSGGTGFWQAQALEEQQRAIVRDADATDRLLTIDLLYGNEEGGQGRITRFHLRPLADRPNSTGERSCEVARHRITRFHLRPLADRPNSTGERSCEVARHRITRFHLRPLADRPNSRGERSCEVARHWNIDTLEGSWPEQQGHLRLATEPTILGM